jgi:hypothetical protein
LYGCRLESGGPKKRTSAIAVQTCKTHDQFNSYFRSAGKCDARHFILNGAVRNSALAGGAALIAPKQARGRPKRPPGGG